MTRKLWMQVLLLGIGLGLDLVPASPILAATIHVPADQPTIQAGIAAAEAGDVVLVSCGTYKEHDLVMKSGVTLRSQSGDPACATIDAQRLGRVLRCDGVDATACIEGFTLTNGFLEGYDLSSRGGAIWLSTSSPTIRSCIFRGNEAQAGGGGVFVCRSTSLIENCVFSGNAGVDGGGIYVDYAAPTIRGCTFHDNEALFWGGGIFCENESSPIVIGCTIASNEAYEGGGIWSVNDCAPVIENTLIAYSVRGGGIVAALDPGHDCIFTIHCSDAFGNAGANYGGTLEDPTGTDGNISEDPLLCDPESDDYRVAGDSPCLPQNNECGVLIGANGPGCALTMGVEAVALPEGLSAALVAAPNPFRESVELRFDLTTPGEASIRILDPTGRVIREILRAQDVRAGAHAVTWDGRDDSGREAARGIYFARLSMDGRVTSTQVIAIR
jgi:hypothetical protein